MAVVLAEDFIGGARGTTLLVQLNAGATSLSVAPGGLATWTPVVNGRIPVIINEGLGEEEHLYATAVSGDSLTGLVRAQDGTTDQTHLAGATVTHGLFASHAAQPNVFLSLPGAKGDIAVASGADNWTKQPAGANNTVLIYDSTQATGLRASANLSGLTLVVPTIADFTNAQHDHGDADDGGAIVSGITLTAPTVADFTNAQHDHGDADDGGGVLTPTTLVLPGAITPAQTAEGSVVWDTDNDLLTVGDGTSRKTLVDTGTTQTMINKTLGSPNLVTPTIASFTNAQHDHGDADDGGAIVAAALPASVPRGKVAYGSITADVTGTSGNPITLSGLVLDFTRLYRVSGYCRALSSSVGTDVGAAVINVSSGQLQSFGVSFTANNIGRGVHIVYEGVLPADTVAIGVSFVRTSGTGTWTWNAEADAPSTLLVEDIGAA